MSDYDVFLSHNHEDKPAVERLANRLVDQANLRPFLDKWHLVPGEPFQEAIEEALDQSRACAAFVGPNGITCVTTARFAHGRQLAGDEGGLACVPSSGENRDGHQTDPK
jgi:hypothetical protein